MKVRRAGRGRVRRAGRGSPAVAVATIRVVIPAAVAATVATAVTIPLGAAAVMGQQHHSQKQHRLSFTDFIQGRCHRLSTNDLLQGRGLHRLIRRPCQNRLLQRGMHPAIKFHQKPHRQFHRSQHKSQQPFLKHRRGPRIRVSPPRLRIKRLIMTIGRDGGMPTGAGREVGMPTGAGREVGRPTAAGNIETTIVGTAAPN